MGWLTNIFRGPSPEEHLRRARRWLDKREYNFARIELEGVEGDDAEAIRREVLARLVEINLAEARAQRGAGNRLEAHGALERARCFGATPEQLRAAGADRKD
jgi:hypothetical protein